VLELLEAGVPLCLGTDSLASVPTLDLMDDVVALHRQVPALDPAVIIRLATSGGARALGFTDLGSIEPGRRAAFAFAPVPQGLRDPLAYLVSGEARLSRVAA
jgi:cytosine/adenosine deaminase-related metal-dependent hydrolase